MSELPKLMLKPLRDGFSVGLANPIVVTPTAAGPPRGRADSVSGVHTLSPTYKCTRAMQKYFLSFLRAYRGQWFLAYLVIDDIDHQWYECFITTQGNIPVQIKGDQIFITQLDMVARPIDYDVKTDIEFIKIYQATDGKVDEYYALLEKMVNEHLPESTRPPL